MESGVPFRHARKRLGGQVAQESEGDKQKDSSYESLMVIMMKSGAEMRSFLKIRFHITRHHLER